MPELPRYVGQRDIAEWLGRTYQWVQSVRIGWYKTHAPFPAPDAELQQGSRTVALWLTTRRPEIEEWYRQYQALPGKQRGVST